MVTSCYRDVVDDNTERGIREVSCGQDDDTERGIREVSCGQEHGTAVVIKVLLLYYCIFSESVILCHNASD